MVKISNRDLYIAVGVMTGVSVLVNIIWSGVTGFPTQYVSVDPNRPSKDYVQCGFSSTSNNFAYFHVAYTGLMLLGGVGLAIAARNVPSLFNETNQIGAAIYNCTLLLAFLIPIVAVGAGGREGAYLLRGYGIIVMVTSTVSILFLPKFYDIYDGSSRTSVTGPTGAGTLTNGVTARTGRNDTNMGSVADSDEPQVRSNEGAVLSSPSGTKERISGPEGKYAVGAAAAVPLASWAPNSPTVLPADWQQQRDAMMEEIAQLRQRLRAAEGAQGQIVHTPASPIVLGSTILPGTPHEA